MQTKLGFTSSHPPSAFSFKDLPLSEQGAYGRRQQHVDDAKPLPVSPSLSSDMLHVPRSIPSFL